MPGVRWVCSEWTRGRPRRSASSCARVTSPCSTRSTPLGRSAGPPRGRCRSWPSAATTRGSSSPSTTSTGRWPRGMGRGMTDHDTTVETGETGDDGGRARRGVVERSVEAVTTRTGTSTWLTTTLRKVFPTHFSFLWGELALYSFVILLLAGTYLTFFFEGSQEELIYAGDYEPLRGQEVSAAFDSVMRISFETKGGLLIRQMHHWAALVFVGAVAIHMARVYFTGAFRRPRD